MEQAKKTNDHNRNKYIDDKIAELNRIIEQDKINEKENMELDKKIKQYLEEFKKSIDAMERVKKPIPKPAPQAVAKPQVSKVDDAHSDIKLKEMSKKLYSEYLEYLDDYQNVIRKARAMGYNARNYKTFKLKDIDSVKKSDTNEKIMRRNEAVVNNYIAAILNHYYDGNQLEFYWIENEDDDDYDQNQDVTGYENEEEARDDFITSRKEI